MEYKKVSNTELEVTKQIPITMPIISRYKRSFIESQIIAITQQRNDMIALKEAELKECNDILKQMDNLGIVKEEE